MGLLVTWSYKQSLFISINLGRCYVYYNPINLLLLFEVVTNEFSIRSISSKENYI